MKVVESFESDLGEESELLEGWRDVFSRWSSGDNTSSRVVNCVVDQKKREIYSNRKGCLQLGAITSDG